MSTTINERIDLLIKAMRMNKATFANSIHKTPTTIQTIVSGRNKPGFDVLEAIATTYPQINTDWLIRGKGEMLRSDAVEIEPSLIRDDEYLMRHLANLEAENKYLREANQVLLGKSDDVPHDQHECFAVVSEIELACA